MLLDELNFYLLIMLFCCLCAFSSGLGLSVSFSPSPRSAHPLASPDSVHPLLRRYDGLRRFCVFSGFLLCLYYWVLVFSSHLVVYQLIPIFLLSCAVYFFGRRLSDSAVVFLAPLSLFAMPVLFFISGMSF